MKRVSLWFLCLVMCVFAVTLAMAAEQLPAPSVSVQSAAVTRGDLLEITLGEVDGAVSYWVALEDANGEVITRNASEEAGTVYLSSALADAGTYTVRAWVRDEERNDGLLNQDTTVTVKAYTGSANSVVIRTPKEDVYVGEGVYISVYAPSATALHVFDPKQPGVDWWGSDSPIWVSTVDFFQEPGSATLYAEAYGADGSVVQSENLHFTVTEKGKIGEPTMSLEEGTYPAGEDIQVAYAFGENVNISDEAIIYGYSVYNTDSDREMLFDTEELASSGTFVVDGSLLENGGTYTVELYAYSKEKGYKAQYIDRKIMAAYPSDDRLSLTSRGYTEVNVLTGENVPLTIHAPGATAIHLFKGSTDDWDYWGDAEGFWDDIPYMMSWGNSDTMILYLEVCYDKDFEDYEHVTWVYSDPLIIHVTSPQGQLNPPTIEMPKEVTVGSVLQIPAVMDEHADWAYVTIIAGGEDGIVDWANEYAGTNLNGDGIFYVNTSRLIPGQEYCVAAFCGGRGWENSVSTYRWFTAKGTASTQAQFEASKTNLETNEQFALTGYVPGATEMILYTDHNPDFEWGHYWEQEVVTAAHLYFEDAGEHSVTLSACVDGEWRDVGTIDFTVSATHGQLKASQIDLPLEIAFGEDLEIVFPEVAQATRYHYSFNIDGGEYIGEDERKTPGALTIRHEDLQEGQIYRIFLDVSAQGYESYRQEHCVMIGYAEDRGWIDNPSNPLTLRHAKTELETGEVMPLTAFAPGATGIQLWVNGILQDERFDVSGCVFDFVRGNAGKYVIGVAACYEDWSDWRDCQVTVNVTSNGQSVGDVTLKNAVLGDGEDLVLTVTKSAASLPDFGMYVSVNRQDNWDEVYSLSRFDEAKSFEITIPSSAFEDENALYRVNVGMDAPGYESFERSFDVVRQSSYPVDARVSIYVDNSEIETFEEVTVTISAPENATQIQFFGGYDLWQPEDMSQENPWVRTLSFGDTVQHIMYALVEIDGEWVASNTVTVNVNASKGPLNAPESIRVTPESTVRGGLVTVSFGAVEGAEWYNIDFNNLDIADDADERNSWGYHAEGTTEFTVSTAELTPGRYYVTVHASGFGVRDAGVIGTEITVTDAGEDVIFQLNKTELLTNERLSWGIYVKGAEEVAVCFADDPNVLPDAGGNWNTSGGDSWFADFQRFGNAGDQYAYVSARMAGEDEWHRVTEPTLIHVTAPYGSVTKPEVEFSQTAYAGENYTFTVKGKSGLNYGVAVSFDGNIYEGGDWNREPLHEDSVEGTQTFTIDGQSLGFTDTYVIRVWTNGEEVGYENTYDEYRFVAVARPSEKVTFTVDATNVLTNESFAVYAKAPGAEEIVLYSDGREFARFAFEESDWSTSLNEGTHVLYALARYGEDWVSSETRTVVATASKGSLPAPKATLDKESYERGEFVTVTLTPTTGEGDFWSNINVALITEYGEEFRYGIGGLHETEARIPTVGLEPGRYKMRLGTDGVGYRYTTDGETILYFTVTETENTFLFKANKTEVLLHEEFELYVYARGAEAIRLSHMEEDNEWGTWDGEYVEYNGARIDDGDGEQRLYASAMYDGQWSDPVLLTLNLINFGEAPVPGGIPFTAKEGEDFTFHLTVPGGVDHLIVWVNSFADGNPSLLDSMDVYGDTDISFPISGLHAGDGFAVTVHSVGGYGHMDAEQTFDVHVVGQGNNRVTMTAPEVSEVHPGEHYYVTVNAPGADEIIILCNQDEHRRDGDITENNDFYEYYDAGTYELYAMARFGDEWVTAPQSYIVTFVNDGRLDAPVYAADETGRLGEYFRVSVQTPEHTSSVGGHIYDAQSGESITEFASRPVSGTFELSAFLDDRFNEGTTYGFFLWVNGPGYDGNGIDGTFTVVPGSAESFTLSTAKILTGESFQYFITTSANDVRVKIGDDSIEDVVTNEPAEISMWGYDAGTYTVTAQKKNGSTWSNIGTAQKIEVVKIGTMDTPKANIPAYVYDGSDLKITNVLENLVDGGWYQVVLRAMSGEDGFEMIKDTNSEGNSDTVVFPASVLEAGKEYMVCVQYYAFGYDCKDDQVAFVRILDAAFETPDFVLPAALTEIDEEAFEGIAASVVKVPDKVKTIGSKAFANAVNLRQIQIPASVTSIAGDAFEGTSVAIFGVENSYAHTWAVSHGFPFYWD